MPIRRAIEFVRQALEDLSADPANLDNDNLIFNSVVVLGDWPRYNEAIDVEARTQIKQSLKVIDSRLKQADRGDG